MSDGALPATLRLKLHGYSSEQIEFIKVGDLRPASGTSEVEVSLSDPDGADLFICLYVSVPLSRLVTGGGT